LARGVHFFIQGEPLGGRKVDGTKDEGSKVIRGTGKAQELGKMTPKFCHETRKVNFDQKKDSSEKFSKGRRKRTSP